MDSSQYNSRISKSTFDYLNTFYEGCKDESLIKNKQENLNYLFPMSNHSNLKNDSNFN